MPILCEKRGAVAIVTMSRPEARNCWGEDFAEGLAERFAALALDDEVHCAVLTGDEAGRAFCAGANLKDPNTHSHKSMDEFITEGLPKWRGFIVNVLNDFPKPVIAAVNGYAIGVGAIMTFCCDLAVASDRAEWRLPQVQLGIIPAYGGAVRLARWIGKGNAMKLSLGFPMKAEEAYRLGLAQWLVPHGELMVQSLWVAEHVASLSPLATRLTKESMNRGLDIANVGDASLADVYRFMALGLTEDKKQGHAAWREHRHPKTRGE